MTDPRVGLSTVMTARSWESRLARHIQDTACARLVSRIADPVELVASLPLIGTVVIGAETPWLEPWVLDVIRDAGVRLVGVRPESDPVALRLLDRAHVVLVENAGSDVIAAAAAAA